MIEFFILILSPEGMVQIKLVHERVVIVPKEECAIELSAKYVFCFEIHSCRFTEMSKRYGASVNFEYQGRDFISLTADNVTEKVLQVSSDITSKRQEEAFIFITHSQATGSHGNVDS